MSAVARHGLVMGGAIALCCALGGCSDPYQRDGTWRPTGVNDANLRAMIANPADLQWGASTPGGDGQLAGAAVARWRAGQVKAISSDSIAKGGSSSGSGGQAASASPAAGGN